MPAWLTDFFAALGEAPAWLWVVAAVAVLLIWFLPTLIALVRNRAYLRVIALLNIPGGLSWIVWTALVVWAASGKGPPPDIARNAGKNWPWIAVVTLVIVAALVWHFANGG